MQNPSFMLCVGAAHWDIIGRTSTKLAMGDDVTGRVERRPGGVALNLALGLARHGIRVSLCSAVGDDAEGSALINHLENSGVASTYMARIEGAATGHYIAIEDDRKALFAAIADTALLDNSADTVVEQAISALASVSTVVLEANLAATALQKIAHHGAKAGARIIANPVSPAKAHRLGVLLSGDVAPTLVVNLAEACVLLERSFNTSIDAARALQARCTATALVTDGPRPAALATPDEVVTANPPQTPGAASITGAGDALMSAFLASQDRQDAPGDSLRFALSAAAAHMQNGEAA
ncbi:MAG: PfkB family carbohydrate kinase [Pseudomonadota bacterium]